jgi:hypothetical protein
MSCQGRDAVVGPTNSDGEKHARKMLRNAQKKFDRAVRATVTASRIAAGACDAAGVANTAVVYNAPDRFIATYAAAGIATDARDAAAAANAAVVDAMPAIRLMISVLEDITRAVSNNSNNNNNNSPDDIPHSIQPSEEPTTITAESQTAAAEPATITTQPAVSTIVHDDDDDDDDSTCEETPSPSQPNQHASHDPATTPALVNIPAFILITIIAAVSCIIFWKINEEVFFMAVLLVVLTVLVPFCWSYRAFTWLIASCETVAFVCVLLLVVVCILGS